jgi:predicted DCC family thiol-disulfide oxidoreductase YuxK
MGPPPPRHTETLVLYGEDCAFCRWSSARLRAWDRHGRLDFRSIQTAQRERRLDSLARDARYVSWHVVTPDGHVWPAGPAVPPLMRRLPGGRPLAALAERLPASTDRVHRLIARHRGRLGAFLGQQACAVDPGRSRTPEAESRAEAIR